MGSAEPNLISQRTAGEHWWGTDRPGSAQFGEPHQLLRRTRLATPAGHPVNVSSRNRVPSRPAACPPNPVRGPTADVRLAMPEAVEAIRGLLTGESFRHHGGHDTLQDT
jgi:hypothetical protein